MGRVRVEEDRLIFDGGFTIRLERTLRVPNDGRSYPLPPSLGAFPIYRTRDYEKARQAAGRGEYFVPMYQWEAMWLSFEVEHWRPKAVQVSVGGINVLTGEAQQAELREEPQNYLVCPTQLWLDGIRTETGSVRQFVAAPLGMGLSVEEQLRGEATQGGLQVAVIGAKRGVFPEKRRKAILSNAMCVESFLGGEMGLAGGGAIDQKVYPDPHGIQVWDPASRQEVSILILNSRQFRQVTGKKPPRSPIDAKAYERHGLPWFELYEEGAGDVGAVAALRKLKTVAVAGDSAKAEKIVRIERIRRPERKKEVQ